MKKIFSIFAALLFAGSVLADDELMLTMDLAGASAGTPSKEIKTEADLLAFLKKTVPSADNIKSVGSTITKIYDGKGSGGAGIPDKVMKIGTSSAAGEFSFTIADELEEITKVEITGYGWNTETGIVVNGSAPQNPDEEKKEQTFAFPLSSATRTITIGVATSLCATEIKLYKEVDPSAPRIKAANLDLGEFVLENPTWLTGKKITVEGVNLSDDIVIFKHTDGITVTAPTGGTNLPAEGGDIEFDVWAKPGTPIKDTIWLESGSTKKTVLITGIVKEKKEIPTGAVVDKITGVSNSMDVTVNSITGVKAGTKSNAGELKISVSAGAEKLYFYAAAWTGKPCQIEISVPTGVTISAPELDSDSKISLKADDGIGGNGTKYTLTSLDPNEDCLFILTFDSPLAAPIEVTMKSASSGEYRRFVVWGAKQLGGTATSIENAVIENNAAKQIVNGQVVIIRDNVRYNVIGQTIE